MKNAWLARRPKIYQQLNPYNDCYGKWYIIKGSGWPDQEMYLHKDGKWRVTTFNLEAGGYSGYFDTFEDAEKALKVYET